MRAAGADSGPAQGRPACMKRTRRPGEAPRPATRRQTKGMKKLLLSSVAMAGASALATGALAVPIQSFDEDGTPVLTAGMSAQFEGGVVIIDDKLDGPEKRDGGFVNGRFGEIYFNGELTADNGLVYGARIHFASSDFHFQTADDWGHSNAFPGREYMYFKGDWGTLELGNWPGPDSTLNFTPSPTTYKGIGGLDYAYKSYAEIGRAHV